MALARESTTDVCGCRALLRRGGSGSTVLYLHGAGGLPGWLPFLEQLADRYDVLAPDHPSFGASETPQWLDSVGDLAYYYLEYLKQLGLDRVHLIGHSMGGWTALEMAIRSTQRIASMTLIAPVGIRLKGHPVTDIFVLDRDQLTRKLIADPELLERELQRTPSPEEEARVAKSRIAAARLAWQPRFFNPGLQKWLHRIDVPTHVVWGDADGIISPVYADAFRNLIPGTKVTIVPKTGHSPHVEKPAAVLDVVCSIAGR